MTAALLDRLPEALRPLAADLPARRVALALDLLDRRLNGVAVLAEAVHRRHNVSAILRTAEGFGVHEAHLITTERFRPSKGAAKGAERWLSLRIHPETGPCLRALQERGFAVYVADLDDAAVAPWAVPVDRPLAVLFGAELSGVSPEARAAADGVVCIPMHGVTQSLNVAAAAAVTLNHLCERRRQVPGAVGIQGEAREVFLRRFLERERSRRQATAVTHPQ
ncbi:MAG: RNA methyltransferase [Alphaproteobacteria bacterium]|nr:RNA methyltransferase [Alphaproteobacteria bacterium]